MAEGHCEAPCVKSRSQNWDPTSWKLWEQEISGTNCSSGSGFGPVTTQRVTGRTDGRTDGLQVHRRYKKKAEDQSEANVQTNTTAGACCGNQLAAETSAWRFPERTAVAVPVLVRLSRKEWRVGPTDGQTSEFIYKIWESNDTTLLNVDGRTLFFFPGHVISDSCEQGSHLPVLRTIDRLLLDQVQCEPAATNAPVGCYVQKVWNTKTQR